MILRDSITQVKIEKESDGMGGKKRKGEEVRITFDCKASFNTSPEVATAYGVSSEQILYVVTRDPLDKGAYFLFKNKKYTMRFDTTNGRLFYYTLIEVKKGA